jgi:hypothetical protein
MAEPLDRESVDRTFAEMVAAYHLTAERTEPQTAGLTATDEPRTEHPERSERVERPEHDDGTGPTGAVTTPGAFPFAEPAPVLPAPVAWRGAPEAPEVPDEPYVPDPLPPLSRPGAPAMVGWAGVLFAAVVVLAAGFGLHLPAWLGWLTVTSFIVGSVVLLTQLPRHRPPGSGDGAVV